MSRHASRFSQEEEVRVEPKKLMINPCYQNLSLTSKEMPECGEAEVVKGFYIEITSQGELHVLEFEKGEILSIVKSMFKKHVLLGHSPSGFKILGDLGDIYFREIEDGDYVRVEQHKGPIIKEEESEEEVLVQEHQEIVDEELVKEEKEVEHWNDVEIVEDKEEDFWK